MTSARARRLRSASAGRAGLGAELTESPRRRGKLCDHLCALAGAARGPQVHTAGTGKKWGPETLSGVASRDTRRRVATPRRRPRRPALVLAGVCREPRRRGQLPTGQVLRRDPGVGAERGG